MYLILSAHIFLINELFTGNVFPCEMLEITENRLGQLKLKVPQAIKLKMGGEFYERKMQILKTFPTHYSVYTVIDYIFNMYEYTNRLLYILSIQLCANLKR